MELSSGPLQGITDDVFRAVHQEVFGGINAYYGPYVRLENHKEAKKSQVRDTESTLNQGITYIPQILSSQAPLILEEAKRLKALGHQIVNWNLGCPYPMVTKRNMGAGLLNQSSLIKEILDALMPEFPMALSIKCRLGLESNTDIFPLIDLFNQYAIKEIIVHARTGKQMYKGSADAGIFKELIPLSRHPLGYNGDINSVEKFQYIQESMEGKINHFMLGRGLIMKPHLASAIQGEELCHLKTKLDTFHQKLIQAYLHRYQEHQLLPKMRGIWEFLSHSFSDPHKVFKLIKKSKSWNTYQKNTSQIFHQFELCE